MESVYSRSCAGSQTQTHGVGRFPPLLRRTHCGPERSRGGRPDTYKAPVGYTCLGLPHQGGAQPFVAGLITFARARGRVGQLLRLVVSNVALGPPRASLGGLPKPTGLEGGAASPVPAAEQGQRASPAHGSRGWPAPVHGADAARQTSVRSEPETPPCALSRWTPSQSVGSVGAVSGLGCGLDTAWSEWVNGSSEPM